MKAQTIRRRIPGENGSSVQNVDGTSAEGSDGQNGKSPDASGDNETAQSPAERLRR